MKKKDWKKMMNNAYGKNLVNRNKEMKKMEQEINEHINAEFERSMEIDRYDYDSLYPSIIRSEK